MSTRTGGQVLVDALRDHGVEVVWGIPGTHNLAIYEALAGSGIRHLLPRHEQGAGFAADGYARSSGRVGVCVTTSGPAVLNAATALAQAYSDSVPVLLVSAGMPVGHPGRGNGTLHETKDLTAAMNGVVAYSHRISSIAEIPVAVAQAFSAMSSGRPRPLHLEVPYDLLDGLGEAPRVTPSPAAHSVPSPSAVAAAAARVAGSRRPVIIAGGGARWAAADVIDLAESLSAPVVCSVNGKGVVPDHHALAMGAGLHRRPVAELAAESDLVLVLGCELSPADLWEGPLDLDGRIVRVDVDPAMLVTNGAPAAALLGDVGEVVRALLRELPTTPDDLARERRQFAETWRETFVADAQLVSAAWHDVLGPIEEALGEQGILAGDSTKTCYLGAVPGLAAHGPSQFLYPSGYGTLGYGLPAAIGAKTAFPDRRVLCLIGDGGVMFTLAELAAAAQLRVALPVVVADNSGFGEIRDEMLQRGQEPIAVDIPSPDFVAVARGLGCEAHRVEGADELRAALEKAFATDVPTLLHVRTA